MSLTPLQRTACILRKMHLLHLADLFWFLRLYCLNRRANKKFVETHSGVPVPPPFAMYDILGNCDLSGFYSSGQQQASEIAGIIAAGRPGRSLRILEWGCGPARILQHLKSTDGSSWDLWGSDYNPRSISWCRQHWPAIQFVHNGLEPPIDLEDDFFDVIYCVSVFTHLSETRHNQWLSEIYRLLRPGGLFIGTFHGEAFREQLTYEEQRRFDSGALVVRDNVREGKKDFAAYHSDDFVRSFLSPFAEARKREGVTGFNQTVWTAVKGVL